MRSFVRYAAASLVAGAVLAVVVGAISDGTRAVWPMVALAYAAQLVAFG
ncbi:MAG: hypothetical protein GWO39_08475, partial [Gammaproteobacteria bacterium]|nr:hypothetical protein [Gammaproteobacteria bacterium]NIY32385.1 hypothetical protein [Gammaproteobacteria bacterium]